MRKTSNHAKFWYLKIMHHISIHKP